MLRPSSARPFHVPFHVFPEAKVASIAGRSRRINAFLCWAVRQQVFPASGGSDFRLTQPLLVYTYSRTEFWWQENSSRGRSSDSMRLIRNDSHRCGQQRPKPDHIGSFRTEWTDRATFGDARATTCNGKRRRTTRDEKKRQKWARGERWTGVCCWFCWVLEHKGMRPHGW
jgi:hypothetical protein